MILCGGLVAASAAVAADEVARGRDLAIEHCARCHVIGDYNRMGGLGNTPSFMALTWSSDYAERVLTFYKRRPHPVFTRVNGYERWSQAPAYAPEFEITLEEIQDILAYIRTLVRDPPAPQ